ncbi:MAG TPA: TlpA disulfide reductase family protein [Gammaproteobacteria bacterium]|nr:TlpA disulfide reductase family protein [Gammaproteobacteria bacterium]
MEAGLGGLQLGPLVLAWPRLFALLAAAAVLAVAGWLAVRRDRALAGWGWAAVLAGGLTGRLAYVALHWPAFAAEPWSIPAFWQGGLQPWGAAAGAAAFGLWRFRRSPRRRFLAQLPVAAGLGLWLLLSSGHAWLAGPAQVRLPAGPWPALAGEARLAPPGRPAVVNLWASWCPPCRREMPRLAQAAEAHPGVSFAYVNQGEERAAVAAFADRFGLRRGRVFLDPGRRLAERFGTVGLPATLFFDRSGRLLAAHVGEISRAALGDRVDSLTRR